MCVCVDNQRQTRIVMQKWSECAVFCMWQLATTAQCPFYCRSMRRCFSFVCLLMATIRSFMDVLCWSGRWTLYIWKSFPVKATNVCYLSSSPFSSFTRIALDLFQFSLRCTCSKLNRWVRLLYTRQTQLQSVYICAFASQRIYRLPDSYQFTPKCIRDTQWDACVGTIGQEATKINQMTHRGNSNGFTWIYEPTERHPDPNNIQITETGGYLIKSKQYSISSTFNRCLPSRLRCFCFRLAELIKWNGKKMLFVAHRT